MRDAKTDRTISFLDNLHRQITRKTRGKCTVYTYMAVCVPHWKIARLKQSVIMGRRGRREKELMSANCNMYVSVSSSDGSDEPEKVGSV